jgi:hypothetical protein
MIRVNFEITCDAHSEEDCKGCGLIQCPHNPIHKEK